MKTKSLLQTHAYVYACFLQKKHYYCFMWWKYDKNICDVDRLNEKPCKSDSKIRRLVERSELIPIVRGPYETDKNFPGYYPVGSIHGPSYLSFEFALGHHPLIQEAVHQFTSATFEKNKKKQYETPYDRFTHRDVPSEAYPHGAVVYEENGCGFQITSPEKALYDKLYTISHLKNQATLNICCLKNCVLTTMRFVV